MAEHEWCLTTLFCLKCGAAQLGAYNGDRAECLPTNVVPISHLISRRRFQPIVPDAVLGVEA